MAAPTPGSLRARRIGVSAMEVALCAPVFIVLLLFGIDMLRGAAASQRVDRVADTIGRLIAANETGTVSDRDLQFVRDSAMLVDPHLLVEAKTRGVSWSDTIAISVSSVDFGPAQSRCGSACTYTPRMVWSGGAHPRSCTAAPIEVGDAEPPSPTTLPARIYGPGSRVIVDVVYEYRPVVASHWMRTLTISRSVYIAPRLVSVVDYRTITAGGGLAVECANPGS